MSSSDSRTPKPHTPTDDGTVPANQTVGPAAASAGGAPPAAPATPVEPGEGKLRLKLGDAERIASERLETVQIPANALAGLTPEQLAAMGIATTAVTAATPPAPSALPPASGQPAATAPPPRPAPPDPGIAAAAPAPAPEPAYPTPIEQALAATEQTAPPPVAPFNPAPQAPAEPLATPVAAQPVQTTPFADSTGYADPFAAVPPPLPPAAPAANSEPEGLAAIPGAPDIADQLSSEASSIFGGPNTSLPATPDYPLDSAIDDGYDNTGFGHDDFLAGTPDAQSEAHGRSGRRFGLMTGIIGLLGGVTAAGVIGYMMMKPDVATTAARRVIDTDTPLVKAPAAPKSQNRLAVRKPLRAAAPRPARRAALTVGNVSGSSVKPISLSIDARALPSDRESYISIQGVPDDASLSSGLNMGNGTWLLPPAKLKGLSLQVPGRFEGNLTLIAQVMETDANTPITNAHRFNVRVARPPQPRPERRVAALPQRTATPKPASTRPARSRQLPKLPAGASDAEEPDNLGALPQGGGNTGAVTGSRFAVPARAPRVLKESLPEGPPAIGRDDAVNSRIGNNTQVARLTNNGATAPAALSRAQINNLIKRGDNLFRIGDLSSARLIYRQVAATGNAEAALAMGRTFDPVYFEKLDVRGFRPDPDQALSWYRRAVSAGSTSARSKITNLLKYLGG